MDFHKGSLIILVPLLTAFGCGDSGSVERINGTSGRVNELSIERFSSSPLTALARFSTDTPSKIRITTLGQDGEDLTQSFDEYATKHEIPVLGLYPDFRNTVLLSLESRNGNIAVDTILISTRPLPFRYRNLPLVAIRSGSAPLAPGFFLLLLSKEFGGSREEGMFLAVDNFGKIRWVYTGDYWFLGKMSAPGKLVVQLPSVLKRLRKTYNLIVERLLALTGWHSVFRHLYWGIEDTHTPELIRRQQESPSRSLQARVAEWLPRSLGDHNALQEIDLLGRAGRSWKAEGHSIHHDFIFLPNGNLLALASTFSSDEDLIIEIGSQSGTIDRVIDLKEVLDVKRPQMPRHLHDPDWLHANALFYDEQDSTIVISARNQSAVVKLTLDSLKIRWIMGSHEKWASPYRRYLLEPIGKDFSWQWGQHAPILSPQDPNRMLVYDNGNQRSYDSPMSPESSFSRAVEYEIDDTAGTVRQTWEFGGEYGSELYTPIVGNAEYVSNGNRLICFGAIPRDLNGRVVEWVELAPDSLRIKNRSVKSSARIFETTGEANPKTLFELRIEDGDRNTYVGYLVYRAHKIFLY